MKKPDRYVYPAVFSYEDGQEIAVVFPDLDVATSGVNDDDALISARELLGCGLIFAAVILTQLPQRRKQAASVAAAERSKES